MANGGGSGTAFIKTIYLSADVSQLVVDNAGVKSATIEKTYFDEGNNTEFTINELHILSNAHFHIEGLHSELIAKRLICEKSGTIYIPNNINFTTDTELATTAISCSLKISKDGEIRLPQEVTFLGQGNELFGK